MLDKSDVISHLMNGYCANHLTPACAEISHRVKSPVTMAITITEIVINEYSRGQLSSRDLRDICFAIGIEPHPHREEGSYLIDKLKQRCKDLRPLLNYTGLENVFGAIEDLGKKSLQELAIQHQVDLPKTRNVDDIRTDLVDHISSGGCESSRSASCVSLRGDYRNTASSYFETRVLKFTSEKGNVTKTTLKRILERKQVKLSRSNGINQLRKRFAEPNKGTPTQLLFTPSQLVSGARATQVQGVTLSAERQPPLPWETQALPLVLIMYPR